VNLILSGRGLELDERLRQYATDKLSHVERFYDRIIKMEVELRRERNASKTDRHRVDVTVKTPRETLRAHGEGVDHYAAIDIAADRLETQIKKRKAKLRDHAHRNGHVAPAEPDDGEPGPRIVRLQQLRTKPMTADEAVVELDDRAMNFLLFTDAETMRASVVYRRADGSFGVVEHES